MLIIFIIQPLTYANYGVVVPNRKVFSLTYPSTVPATLGVSEAIEAIVTVFHDERVEQGFSVTHYQVLVMRSSGDSAPSGPALPGAPPRLQPPMRQR